MTASHPICQGCGAALTRTLVDLGMQPLANSYVRPEDLDKPEPVYPLHARVCDACLLVQVDDVGASDPIASRLRDLGFVDGERVRLVTRGPLGGEPLLVQVGFTRFALRKAEALRIVVTAAGAAA